MRAFLLLTLAAILSSSAATRIPTSPSQEPLVLTVRTDFVTLAVTVIDRRGRVVSGLSRDVFTVYDNGEPQPIRFFDHGDLPATVGLVIDSSSSMRGRRDEITAAGAAFAALSHPLDELFTFNFNEAVWPGLPPPARFAADAGELRRALAAAPVRGRTALYDAVDRAIDHLEFGTRDSRALIVVSDGGDNASRRTLNDVLEHARRSRAVIYAVIVADPDDHDARPGVLKKLASETGGEAFTPERAGDTHDAFARIAEEIRSAYSIGFSAPDARQDGFRPLRVVVDAGDHRPLVARTRAGYYAKRSSPVVR